MFLFLCRPCELTVLINLLDDFQTFHASRATLHHIANLSVASSGNIPFTRWTERRRAAIGKGKSANPRRLLFFGKARGLNRNTENKSVVFAEVIRAAIIQLEIFDSPTCINNTIIRATVRAAP